MYDCENCDLSEECSLAPDFASCLKEEEASYIAEVRSILGGSIFFSADHHFGHENIIKHCSRPYSDAFDMGEDYIRRWNSRVTDHDIVYYLGDFSWFRDIQYLLSRLFFKQMYFMQGNHDDKRAARDIHTIDSRVVRIEASIYDLNIGLSCPIVLCHYPIADWPRRYHGAIHLHGHSHGTASRMKNRLDIGVDNFPDLITLEEVLADTKKGMS